MIYSIATIRAFVDAYIAKGESPESAIEAAASALALDAGTVREVVEMGEEEDCATSEASLL